MTGLSTGLSLEKRDRIRNKKTKRGTVAVVVRELYLRTDIPCLSLACSSCQQNTPTELISADYLTARLEKSASHYLILDPLILVKYIELFELNDIQNIIISQTCLNWVQLNEEKRLYQRIRKITNDPRRCSIVFSNENLIDTFIEREKGESQIQRDLKALHLSAIWYQKHLQNKIPIVFIHDTEPLEPFKNVEGVLVMKLEEYLSQFWSNHSILMDLFHSVQETLKTIDKNEPTSSTANEFGYTEYKSENACEVGIKTETLFRGKIDIDEYNAQDEAIISTSTHGKIFISGQADRNRAVHGDLVVVELYPKSQWKVPAKYAKKQIENQVDEKYLLPTGRVVGILQRNWRTYVATLQETDQMFGYFLVIPMDYRIPKIRIRINDVSKVKNRRLVVRIDSWPIDSQYPKGHFIRSLGEVNQIDTEVSAILVEHSIEVPPFSQALLDTLPQDTPENPWKITSADLKERRDLRETHFICSIDPLGSEDIDDSLSIRMLPNGNYELGVHIADVTHFVEPGSLCDIEAQTRGTTVYLSDRRFNMIPAILSENLCSLRGGVDRFAVSVLSELTPNGKIVQNWFGKTVIKSAKEFYYEQAQAIIDEKPNNDEMLKKLEPEFIKKARSNLVKLVEIARILKKSRLDEGALELESAEIRFRFGQNEVSGIVPKNILEIHQVVAECMIFANAVVATQISKVFPSCSLLRNHPQPVQDNFSTLSRIVETTGLSLDTRTNRLLSSSLETITENLDPETTTLVKTLATMAMSEAEYFSTGSTSPENYFHYGLALQRYTHFTSPIRRYADIIVHRQLIASLNPHLVDNRFKNNVLNSSWVEETSDHLNQKNRNSKYAQKDSTELFECLYIMKEVKEKQMILDAIVYEIRSNGLMIYVPLLGLRGLSYFKDKNDQLILSPSLFEKKPSQFQSTMITSGTYTPEGGIATISTSTGKVIDFKVFDKIKILVSLTPSHAHRPTIIFEIVQKSINSEGTKNLKSVTKKDMIKEIEGAELKDQRKKEPINEDEYQFVQTPPDKSMYMILEKMKSLSL